MATLFSHLRLCTNGPFPLSLDAPQNPLGQPGIPPPLNRLRQRELTPGQGGKSGSDPHIINENPHSRL